MKNKNNNKIFHNPNRRKKKFRMYRKWQPHNNSNNLRSLPKLQTLEHSILRKCQLKWKPQRRPKSQRIVNRNILRHLSLITSLLVHRSKIEIRSLLKEIKTRQIQILLAISISRISINNIKTTITTKIKIVEIKVLKLFMWRNNNNKIKNNNDN